MAPVDGRYSQVNVESAPAPSQADLDRATIAAIKGRGLVVTFGSHFAVAVIVGVAAAFAGHRSVALPESQQQAVIHLTEEVAALRADLVQLRAEVAQQDKNTEWKLNELLTRK